MHKAVRRVWQDAFPGQLREGPLAEKQACFWHFFWQQMDDFFYASVHVCGYCGGGDG